MQTESTIVQSREESERLLSGPAQDLFDFVVRHLEAQGQRAVNANDACRYRAPEGRACAAGCVVDDETYKKHAYEIEGNGAGTMLRRCLLPAVHMHLVQALQRVHDYDNSWSNDGGLNSVGYKDLAEIASEFGLNYTVPEKVSS